MVGEENKEKIPLKERKINDGQSSNASVNGDNGEDECQGSLFSKRYIISILALLGFCNVYALRVNLSVALVAMVTNSTVSNSEGKNVEVCNSFLFSVRQLKIVIIQIGSCTIPSGSCKRLILLGSCTILSGSCKRYCQDPV